HSHFSSLLHRFRSHRIGSIKGLRSEHAKHYIPRTRSNFRGICSQFLRALRIDMCGVPMSKDYNGWTNYETWCANLWMSNDAGSDEFYREMAQDTYNDAEAEHRADNSVLFTRDDIATRNLSDRLKDDLEERQTELTGIAGVFADLLGAAMSEINWYEIAEHY